MVETATPTKENMRSKSLTRTPLPAQPFTDQPIPVEHAPSEQQHEEPVYVQPIPVQHAPAKQQYEEPVSAQGASPPSSPSAPAASSPEPQRTPAPSSPVPAHRPRRIRRPNSMLNSDTWDLSSLG